MKNPNPNRYKQIGPKDEMVALISSVHGDMFMLQLGPENRVETVARAASKLTEILNLLRQLPEDKWD